MTIRKVGDCFCVVTPWLTTSSGRRASAWLTRFCTLHLRVVGIGARAEGDGHLQHAVGAGDRLHVHHVLDAVDRFLQRRSDTVSAITLGLAPG